MQSEIIDGRKAVIAHGTRDMPIWGDRYVPEPSKALIPRPSENILSLFLDPETVVRMRILAVIDYLIESKKGNPALHRPALFPEQTCLVSYAEDGAKRIR